MTEPRAGWPERNSAAHPVWLDASFTDLVRRHPALDAMRRFLPLTAGTPVFQGQDSICALQSSYVDRGYGSLFYALVRALRPQQCVEIGLFQGFSLLSAAAALRDNDGGAIAGYDLFDAYPYRHAQRAQLTQQVVASGLEAWTTVHQADAAAVHEQVQAVDYLHVDVSNDGDTYRQVFAQWSAKVRQVILLEGGSRERDNVDWMVQFGKPAIVPAIADLRRAHPEWSISVLEPFPSLTVAINLAAMPDPRQP